MSLLQSALDFLAGPGSLGGASGRDHSDFVGQTVELGELRLRVRRVLAEAWVLPRSVVSRTLRAASARRSQRGSWIRVGQGRVSAGGAVGRGSVPAGGDCGERGWVRVGYFLS
ncbi:hypothetical protein P7K49_005792 [Saguinus oedipus]|uniref:Uncharacterized protein n=1 Tax=Saguinus oedipus TaxID=9490 RepID=A0ABQ9W0M0_SAGOE|nr:hypothetical protein P7K49_005792 [Saguinus oedipus]